MPKVLVADDNTNIQKMVSLALEERGINVVSVGNGEAAVRRMPDLEPDLVLADIFMPVRSGYEVCEFVKKDERFAHVPVILLIGAFDPLDEKEARRVGADGVLKKPFVPPDPLIAMVTSALEKNPRVAAELAKAKEPAPAPAEPVPPASVSASPVSEPKPLPEFPELSHEEAEMVYGFGKGRRSDAVAEGRDAAEEPKPPVAERNDQGDDEELESASTPDWRRSAMDFEIPEELAGTPALPASDEPPISFPSEKDYPPRRMQPEEPALEVPPTVPTEPSNVENSFSLSQVEASQPEPGEGVAEVGEPQSSQGTPSSGTDISDAGTPGPYSTAPGGHWLDAVSPSQAEQVPGGWMNALVGEAAEPAEPSAGSPLSTSASSSGAAGEAESGGAPETADLSVEEGTGAAAPAYADLPEQHQDEHHPGDEGELFFAADHEETEPDRASENQDESGFFAPQAADSDAREMEAEPEGSEPSLATTDPELAQTPAVRVTPDPLLVDDEPNQSSVSETASEETASPHSFLAPAPEVPSDAAAAEPPSTTEWSAEPDAAPASTADSAMGDGAEERVATMAPPNREALVHIPFLTPPPSFLAEVNSNSPQPSSGADPETVDAVVQKILEKLQPQLQELLSQGLLKPLVENLLQNELAKKS